MSLCSPRHADPSHKPWGGTNLRSSGCSPSPRLNCRSISRRAGVASEGLERHYNQVCPPQPPGPPQALGLRSIIKNFKKSKKLTMTKTMRLSAPLTLVQKPRILPNILSQVRQL